MSERSSRKEYPDPTPVALPVRFKQQDALAARIQVEVAKRVSQLASDQGFESFEEANDFDVGDGDEEMFRSPHEMSLDQELEYADTVDKILKRGRHTKPDSSVEKGKPKGNAKVAKPKQSVPDEGTEDSDPAPGDVE